MDRERILAASRAENRRGDERARHIDYESFTVGTILMAVMFAVLYFVRRVLRGEEAMTCWPSSSPSAPGGMPRWPSTSAGGGTSSPPCWAGRWHWPGWRSSF